MLVLMMSEQCYLSEDHIIVSWEYRGIKKKKKGGGGGDSLHCYSDVIVRLEHVGSMTAPSSL